MGQDEHALVDGIEPFLRCGVCCLSGPCERVTLSDRFGVCLGAASCKELPCNNWPAESSQSR